MCPSHGILKEISKNSHAYLHIWSSNHMNEKHNWLSQDFKCSWMWDQRHHTCMGPCAISTTICKWRRWVRTEVGRSREFVLLCQAHKVDPGMASYVLMWWHDTIIHLIYMDYGAHIVGVVHTCQLGDGTLDGFITIWTHLASKCVHIYASQSLFSCCCFRYLWKQRIVTFVEESLATIEEHAEKHRSR